MKISNWTKDGKKNRWFRDLSNGGKLVVLVGRDLDQSRMFGKPYYQAMFYEYSPFIDGWYDVKESKLIAEGSNKSEVIAYAVKYMRSK